MVSVTEESRRYAPVLERMVELLGSAHRMQFGAAMALACAEYRLPVPPDDSPIHETLLIVSFQIISSGKLPGAPEA